MADEKSPLILPRDHDEEEIRPYHGIAAGTKDFKHESGVSDVTHRLCGHCGGGACVCTCVCVLCGSGCVHGWDQGMGVLVRGTGYGRCWWRRDDGTDVTGAVWVWVWMSGGCGCVDHSHSLETVVAKLTMASSTLALTVSSRGSPASRDTISGRRERGRRAGHGIRLLIPHKPDQHHRWSWGM